MNYEMIVLRNVTMVSSITRGVFLSNVCHLGLAKVIHCGVILGRFGFYVLVVTAQ